MNPLPKKRIFHGTAIILKFFILNLVPFLKVTKFSVKISQFKFLAMTHKKTFVYRLLLSLNIPDLSLLFMQILKPHPEKCHPLFSSKPPVKIEILTSPSPF